MSAARSQPSVHGWMATGAVLLGVVAFLACFVRVGADCYWVVALGDHIFDSGLTLRGLPFAEAPSQDWPNVPVLAELTMSFLHSLGGWALPVFQMAAVVGAMWAVAFGAHRLGASDAATACVIVAMTMGALAPFVIVRLQVFSLLLFPLLVLFLREEAQRPTRRIWLLPLGIAVWTNLHGAVLLGVCVAGSYLLFSRLRLRPVETVVVGALTLVSPLATPVGFATLAYYTGVLENEAAKRSEGLWARPSLDDPLDLVMILSAILLVGMAVRRRRPLWEYVAMAGLAVGTVVAARNGVWLLMTAAAPAAAALTRSGRSTASRVWNPRPAGALAAVALAIATVIIHWRGETVLPADPKLVASVAEHVDDRVVLAPAPLVESLAVQGVRVWVGDPIDAFAPPDQRAYLDFLSGDPGMGAAVRHVDAVVVERGSDAAAVVEHLDGFRALSLPDGWQLFLRTQGN